MAAAPALADGGVVKPTSDQKSAVIKAWSTANGGAPWAGPQSCIRVRLAASNENVAGLQSNVAKKPNKCAQWGFDGSALLYGHKAKKYFLLNEGSDMSPAQCKATANLIGDAWVDLVDFAAGMGCENID